MNTDQLKSQAIEAMKLAKEASETLQHDSAGTLSKLTDAVLHLSVAVAALAEQTETPQPQPSRLGKK